MHELIKQFDDGVKAFSELIKTFPVSRREEKLFDKWSLKDILAHLSGWAIYQQQVINMFLHGHPIESSIDVQAQNCQAVVDREKESWEEILEEWQKSVIALSSLYGSIPPQLLGKSVFVDKKTTPSQLLLIEVRHLKNTHGPQVTKVFESL